MKLYHINMNFHIDKSYSYIVKSYLVMNMELLRITASDNKNLGIAYFGTENIWQNAHWGCGVRNSTILHYVLSGEGYYNGNKISAGEGFFIPQNKLHEYHSSKHCPWTYFFVALDGTKADSLCEKYLNPDKNGIFRYSFYEELNIFIKQLFSSSSISATKAMGMFLILMSMHEEPEPLSKNMYVKEAKNYIKHNLHRAISISEIASSLHISDRYLYNLFIRYEGISPKKYINEQKIKKASRMLSAYNYSVTQAAASVGFNDVLTFSRFFKNQTDMSPSEYKNSMMQREN